MVTYFDNFGFALEESQGERMIDSFFFFLAFARNVHLVPRYKNYEGVVPTTSPIVTAGTTDLYNNTCSPVLN